MKKITKSFVATFLDWINSEMLFLALNNDLHQINVKAQAWTKFPQKDFYHKFYATSGCGSDGRAVV